MDFIQVKKALRQALAKPAPSTRICREAPLAWPYDHVRLARFARGGWRRPSPTNARRGLVDQALIPGGRS